MSVKFHKERLYTKGIYQSDAFILYAKENPLVWKVRYQEVVISGKLYLGRRGVSDNFMLLLSYESLQISMEYFFKRFKIFALEKKQTTVALTNF